MAVPNTQADFDEAYYLQHAPDVAAVKTQQLQLPAEQRWMSSGWDHFQQTGRAEGRRWRNVVTGETGTGNNIDATPAQTTTTTTTTTPATTPPAPTTFAGITSLPVVGPIVVQIGNTAVGLPLVGGFINSIALATGAHPGTVVIVVGLAAYFVLPSLLGSGGGRRR